MLITPPPKFRAHRKPPKIVPPAATVPLALMAASYDPNLLLLTMTFNQPVNTSAAIVTNITVTDPVTNQETYVGTGSFMVYGPNAVQIRLLAQEGSIGSQVTLTIGKSNGIVPASGGAALGAISMLVLPYTHP